MSTRRAAECEALALIALVASVGGCADVQALEPIIRSPVEYPRNTVVAFEFVGAAETGPRSAQRGATFWLRPALNAGACSTEPLVTMSNPRLATTGGWYAALLCNEIAHRTGWQADHPAGEFANPGARAVLQLASQSAEALAYARAARREMIHIRGQDGLFSNDKLSMSAICPLLAHIAQVLTNYSCKKRVGSTRPLRLPML